jgi:hypothetical protein
LPFRRLRQVTEVHDAHEKMSATNQLSFEEAFEKLLPTELKQMIFKFTATDEDNTNELHVKLAADQASSPTLQSSAIALLGNLKKHKSMATMYDQALQYLTDPTFRWVFISDAQPHRFLLVAFRNQVPIEIRERIKHVYLPKVSVEGLVDPATLPQGTIHQTGWIMLLPPTSRYSAYFQRIDPDQSQDVAKIIVAMKTDISLGTTLLPCVLPSIDRLDIGLDIGECIGQSTSDQDVFSTVLKLRKGSRSFMVGPLMSTLTPLVHLKNIADVDIRVFWNDHYQRGRTFADTLNKALQEEVQDLYIREFKQQVPAKSVTSHRKV